VLTRTLGVDLLNRSLLTDFLPAQALRGIGLHLLANVAPLRRLVMRGGLTPAGALPRLMRPGALP
jgi:2-octaprenyl-6-methoxyphenol hydroxylase